MNGHAGEVDSQPVRPPAQQILDTFSRARALMIGDALRVSGSTVWVAGRAAPGPGGPLRATPLADDRSSTAAFALDDATGVLVVDPTTSDIDTDIFAINTLVQVDDPARDPSALGGDAKPVIDTAPYGSCRTAAAVSARGR